MRFSWDEDFDWAEHTQQNCREDFFYFCFSPLLAKINAFTIATDDDDDDVHTILLRVGIDWR